MGNELEKLPEEEQVADDSQILLEANETDDGSEEFTRESEEGDDEDDEDEPIVIPKIKQAISWFWAKRRITLPGLVVVIAAAVMIIPQTRYGAAGLVLRRNFRVTVTDAQTAVAVSDADVTIHGRTVRTDANGVAYFHDLPISQTTVQIRKAYFEDASRSVTVGFRTAELPPEISVKATGRPVPINIINRLTGKGVPGISVSTANTSAITNDQGETTVVLPPENKTYEAVFSGEGYNDLSSTVHVSQRVVASNTFQITPAGDVYYLGKDRNLYRTSLDGTEQTIAQASFTDSLDNFQMQPTADGRFIAFTVNKNDNQNIVVLETETQDFKNVEIKPGQFTDLIGWVGNRLHYRLTRSQTDYWKASRTALKRYDAVDGKSFIIDQNRSHGGSENDATYEHYGRLHMLTGGLFFSKTWIKPAFAEVRATQSDGLYYIRADSNEVEMLQTEEKRSFGTKPTIESYKTSPTSVIIRYSHEDQTKHFRFEAGLLVSEAVDNEAFREKYPNYLLSPGGMNSLWRNQKNQLVVGTQNGQDGSVIEPQTGYIPFGWVTDNYILVLENSDLLVMPSNGLGTLGNRIRIAENIVSGSN